MVASFTSPVQSFYDSNGNPLAGGKIYFYESGTSTPLTTYSDSALSVATSNPVVLDSAGRSIQIFVAVDSYKVVLKDSTDATIWTADPYDVEQIFSASGGLEVSGNTIQSIISVNAQTGTSYTILTGDRGKLVTHTNASAIAVTLPEAGSTGFGSGWYYYTQNRGAGIVTITPTTSTIDGAATITLAQNQGCIIASDGTNYFTMRSVINYTPKAQCILDYVSATSIKLSPKDGNLITISGADYTIPSAGVSAANTSIYIDGTSGQNLAASTVYYVYVFDNAGTVTIDFSTTAYATDSTYGTTIKSGDATRTLVGMIRTNGSSQFADAADERCVLSYHNRRNIHVFAGFTADRTTTSTSYAELNSEIRNEFITWGDEAISTQFTGSDHASASGIGRNVAIGIDGTATFDGGVDYNSITTAGDDPISMTRHTTLSEGYHYLTIIGKTSNASYGVVLNGGSAGARGILETIIRG